MKKYKQIVEVTFFAGTDARAIGMAIDVEYVLKSNEIIAKTHSISEIKENKNRIILGIEETKITQPNG